MPEPVTTSSSGQAGEWSLIPRRDKAAGLAHRVVPAGGDGRWRTACGRVLLGLTPTPAPATARRCGHCARPDSSAPGPRPVTRPPLIGRARHREFPSPHPTREAPTS